MSWFEIWKKLWTLFWKFPLCVFYQSIGVIIRVESKNRSKLDLKSNSCQRLASVRWFGFDCFGFELRTARNKEGTAALVSVEESNPNPTLAIWDDAMTEREAVDETQVRFPSLLLNFCCFLSLISLWQLRSGRGFEDLRYGFWMWIFFYWVIGAWAVGWRCRGCEDLVD